MLLIFKSCIIAQSPFSRIFLPVNSTIPTAPNPFNSTRRMLPTALHCPPTPRAQIRPSTSVDLAGVCGGSPNCGNSHFELQISGSPELSTDSSSASTFCRQSYRYCFSLYLNRVGLCRYCPETQQLTSTDERSGANVQIPKYRGQPWVRGGARQRAYTASPHSIAEEL